MNLEIYAEYIEVRFSLISKTDAKAIIEDGFDEGGGEDLVDSEDADVVFGFVRGEIQFDGQRVASFSCEDREPDDLSILGEKKKWCLMREESGKWEGQLVLDEKFTPDKVSSRVYEYDLNGLRIRALGLFYDGREIEFEGNKLWSERKSAIDRLFAPNGVEHEL